MARFPRMLRVGEAAKLLHVHPNTLRKWNAVGLIHSYRIGRRGDRRFLVADLFKFLAGDHATANGIPRS
ncbi:MAG: helix-turn-helix domain-containing protein [Chloroflexi bacterium]|nr:helix-turn-helix domain-containing protein [Chloroflexota bacterium]